MATDADRWPTRSRAVAQLMLDTRNPRLGRETGARAPREIIQYLFDQDKAAEIAESIASCGFFPNEPLLAVEEDGRTVVIEGNRRLAALKALREPGLLEGAHSRRVERLAARMPDIESIRSVPVTIAPDRASTDRIVTRRHAQAAVLPWQAENRASFILEKLAEGYDNDRLRDDLGFTLASIQEARLTRAVAEMARSIELPDEVKAKVDAPHPKVFSTLQRVFEFAVGRRYMRAEPDPDHGLRIDTTRKEFVKGFSRLVTDIALRRVTSRTLNSAEGMEEYFQQWNAADLPASKRGSCVPSDIITGSSVASPAAPHSQPRPKRQRSTSSTVLPKDLKVRYGCERLGDIRDELVKLKRADFPNAGSVLLRVFFELSVLDYFGRTGELQQLIETLQKKQKLRHGTPHLGDLRALITKAAKERLSPGEARTVEKAVRRDEAAPFGLDNLHSFVHDPSDWPTERDIQQFWNRIEPLFRLMLEQPAEGQEG